MGWVGGVKGETKNKNKISKINEYTDEEKCKKRETIE